MSYKENVMEDIINEYNEYDDYDPPKLFNWDVFLLGGLGGGIGAMLGTLIFPGYGTVICSALGSAGGVFLGKKINDLYD